MSPGSGSPGEFPLCLYEWGHLCLCHGACVQAKQAASWSPRWQRNVTGGCHRVTGPHRLEHATAGPAAGMAPVSSRSRWLLPASDSRGTAGRGFFLFSPGNQPVRQILSQACASPGKLVQMCYGADTALSSPAAWLGVALARGPASVCNMG